MVHFKVPWDDTLFRVQWGDQHVYTCMCYLDRCKDYSAIIEILEARPLLSTSLSLLSTNLRGSTWRNSICESTIIWHNQLVDHPWVICWVVPDFYGKDLVLANVSQMHLLLSTCYPISVVQSNLMHSNWLVEGLFKSINKDDEEKRLYA
jgi:hypothetical protein